MVMVLVLHIDGGSLGLPHLGGDLSSLSSRQVWQLAVESLAIVGVNCFTLISGYFGIRLRLRSVAAYLFQCAFYAVGIYSAAWIACPGRFGLNGWLESWLVLTHTDLWYVPAYFGLMIISPVLNAGFASLGRRQATAVVAAFALFNIWAGWWWEGAFNPSGYTLVQLVMMYLIGRWAALHFRWDDRRRRRDRAVSAAIYLLASAATMLYACWQPERAFAYNSPLVILASSALFMAFTRMEFQSPAVNLLARSAFAVYLTHKAPLVWVGFMKPAVRWLWCHLTLAQFTIATIAGILAVYGVCMCLDWARRRISDLILSPHRLCPGQKKH